MENSQIKFRLKEIQIISKKVAQPPIHIIINGIQNEMLFDMKSDFKVDAEKKIVAVITYTGIRELQSEEYLADFSFAYLFEVIDFDKYIKLTSENVFHIPEQLVPTMKQVAISTSRGIIFSEVRGTYLHNVMMPIINIQDTEAGLNKSADTSKDE